MEGIVKRGRLYIFAWIIMMFVSVFLMETAWAKSAVSENHVATEYYLDVTHASAVSDTYRTIQITFSKVEGVSGYEIYRGETAEDMHLIKDLAGADNISYIDRGESKTYLTTGKKYYYKVRAYVLEEQGEKIYGAFSSVCIAKPSLKLPVITKVEVADYKSIKLTYEKVSGANGYVIYRSTKKDSGFKKIKTIKKGKTVEYIDQKCDTGTNYYYKIRAYRTVDGKKKYSAYSEVAEAVTTLNKPKLKTVTVVSGDTAQLTWKKVSGASGYMIYRSDTKTGKYKRVATVKGGKKTSSNVGGQENGKQYYYQIRAYRTVKKKKQYSKYSNTKTVTFNRFGYADETYMDKAQRIFGLDYYKKYSSKEEADRHMTTITVAAWDFASDGKTKVTKHYTVTVHENIAETVKQIMKEIYEGEERFPIKNIGGYTWRGETSTSEHCCGLALDINWEENYMIENGAIISGKLYQPGINPYSIPTNGEVARIMNKYGFRQGLWGNRCDYMHFSYFGT